MDRTIHLEKTDKHAEAHIELENAWITQGDLDGLHDLLVWVNGFRAGRGDDSYLPGEFDSLMFYRKLGTFVTEQRNKNKKAAMNPSPDLTTKGE